MEADSPVLVGIVVGLPSFALGYLGYMRSKKADAVAEESGTIGQIINGLNGLVARLNDDNGSLRTRVETLEGRLESLYTERDVLTRRVRYLEEALGRQRGLPEQDPGGLS